MIGRRIEQIYYYRRPLWDMAVKQLKVKYIGSLLGIFWAIVNPLLIMLAISFVFVSVFKTGIKDFPLFALAGIFPWMFFSAALSEASTSILGQQSILRQFNLPREIIPLSYILSNFLNFLIGWMIMYPIFVAANHRIILYLPLLIILLVLHFIFVCGLGLALSVFNVFSRDVGQLLGVLLMFWFWVTPVFYSVDMVPAGFQWICNYNPMTPYIIYYRDVVFTGCLPAAPVFTGIFIWAFISITLGLAVFSRLGSKLLKWM
jgi:lipopolysaccharide transport system permease protein